MTDQKPPNSDKQVRKPKNYNVAFIRRLMKQYSGGKYRISKESPLIVSKAIENMIKKITFDAAEFAMNSGRCTIKGKDVQAAIKIISSKEKE